MTWMNVNAVSVTLYRRSACRQQARLCAVTSVHLTLYRHRPRPLAVTRVIISALYTPITRTIIVTRGRPAGTVCVVCVYRRLLYQPHKRDLIRQRRRRLIGAREP